MVRPIYISILAAADEGRGIRLTADEVFELSRDDAIVQRAGVELEDDDEFVTSNDFTWGQALKDWHARRASNPSEQHAEGEDR